MGRRPLELAGAGPEGQGGEPGEWDRQMTQDSAPGSMNAT